MITLAPCSDSSSAVARPMPRAEPVTIATLSSRTPMDGEPSGPPMFGGPPDARQPSSEMSIDVLDALVSVVSAVPRAPS